MENDSERAQWEPQLALWRQRLQAWGLEGIAAALLEAAEPLSLLGAQVLYVAQPALGIFMPGKRVGAWARLLEDPANLAWVRSRLTEPALTPPRITGPGSVLHQDGTSPDEGGALDDPGD